MLSARRWEVPIWPIVPAPDGGQEEKENQLPKGGVWVAPEVGGVMINAGRVGEVLGSGLCTNPHAAKPWVAVTRCHPHTGVRGRAARCNTGNLQQLSWIAG